MSYSFFHSKSLISFVIFFFIILISSEAFSLRKNSQQRDVDRLILEGKKLYESGEYKESIIKFLNALNLSPTKEEQVEIYFNLTLAFYAVGDNSNCKTYLKRLHGVQSDYSIDDRYYPSGYVELFNQIQRKAFFFVTDKDTVEVAEGRKASLRVKLSAKPSSDVTATVSRIAGDIDISVQSDSQLVFTPDNWNAFQAVVLEAEVDQDSNDDQAIIRITAQGISEKEILVLEQDMLTTKNGKKKGKSALFIVAGLAAAGGIVAALLLGKKEKGPTTGSIQVTSKPTGARVYLDGSDTGQITNCTLANISTGSHVVKLVKEAYVDTERTVTVTAGQTATVNINLAVPNITVTDPSGSSSWTKGEQVTIKWTTNGSGNFRTYLEDNSRLSSGVNAIRYFSDKKVTSQQRRALSDETNQKNRKENEHRRVILDRKSRFKGSIDNESSIAGKRNYVNRENEIIGRRKAHVNPGRIGSKSQDKNLIQMLNPSGDLNILAISNVKIDLFKGGKHIRTIADNASNSGSYTWRVDSSLIDDADYKIKVSCFSDSEIYGESAEFIIKTNYVFATQWTCYPSAISVDNSGFLYVAGSVKVGAFLEDRVLKYNTNGTLIKIWGDYYQLWMTGGIAADNRGYVYVSNEGVDIPQDPAYGYHNIVKYTTNGIFVKKWGNCGSGNNQFSEPDGIAIDNSGYVYVADSGNHRIMKFTPNGIFVSKWGSYGSGNYQFKEPYDLAIDNSNYVYVVDTYNYRVMKFTSGGKFITKWGSQGSGDNQFDWPTGIAVDDGGYIYVVDTDNNRVMKFTSEGKFITKWGSYGSGNYQFSYPIGGIAVDSSGNIYVGDSDKIKKYRPSK